MRHKIVLILVT